MAMFPQDIAIFCHLGVGFERAALFSVAFTTGGCAGRFALKCGFPRHSLGSTAVVTRIGWLIRGPTAVLTRIGRLTGSTPTAVLTWVSWLTRGPTAVVTRIGRLTRVNFDGGCAGGHQPR